MRSYFLVGALVVAAWAPACGNRGFADADGGTSDSPFGQDVTFGGGDGSMPPNGPCDSTCAAVGGTCNGGVCTIIDNEGGVSTAIQTQLEGGGTADTQFGFLYPYDQTVWGRNLLPATLQFGGTSAQDVYVHITATTLDYTGFFTPPMGPVAFALTQPMWDAVLAAVQSSKDPVRVAVTKLFEGNVTGPISQTWFVAEGSLRGTIYYETYDSQILGGIGSVGIMKIQPGSAAPTAVKQGCGNVCHTASADGSTLVANTVLGFGSASYDLKSSAATIYAAPGEIFTYGGIYPDGSFVMSATNYRTWFPGNISRLYDTTTGANIPAPGWDGTISNGGTTAFSPDGTKIAFVHEDKDGGATLSVMDFDVATKTFSNLVDVASHPGSYVAWPAFTPDTQYVVYHVGSSDAFETDEGATGDVYAVNLSTLVVRRLDALDGYVGGTNDTYLPAKDPALSFAPTVLPEAVGGYFWIVFTSHRSYGNLLPSQDNGDEYGKLWVAALDIGTPSGADGSHPGFFLDGQEHNSDNLRGFWVLDPCKANGVGCSSGDECCGGFCRGEDGGALVCVPPPGGCAHEYEKCTTSADCCDSGDQCINGKCAVVVN
jgi:WD40-like Beta Propeller Repeat